MKQTFLLFTFFIFAFTANAQITLERSDYPREVGDSTYTRKALMPDQVPIPTEGANQVWDYSNILFDMDNQYINIISEGTSADVPTANIIYGTSSFASIPALQLEFDYLWYERLDETGHYTLAREVKEQLVSLTAVSGGASDSINYVNTLKVYEEPLLYVKFPLDYGDNWVTESILESDFILNLAAFGIIQTPGANDVVSHTEAEVVGWGTLRLPNLSDDSVVEMEALLLKEERTTTSNWTLGGAPAPEALLTAFGLEAGNMEHSFKYKFWVKGLPNQALLIAGDDNEVTRAFISSSIQSSLISTADLAKSNETLHISPNPTAAGQLVTIESENMPLSGALSLLDLTGRLIYTTDFSTVSKNEIQLKIPVAIGKGMFIYQINDQHGEFFGFGKILVE